MQKPGQTKYTDKNILQIICPCVFDPNLQPIMTYVLYNIPLNLDRQEMKLILDYSRGLLLSLPWLSAHTLTKSTGEELWNGDESIQKPNKSPEGLRPCKSCTWARGRWSIIHWEKEKGIEKEQIGEAVEEGEGHLCHAAVTFQHDIWTGGWETVVNWAILSTSAFRLGVNDWTWRQSVAMCTVHQLQHMAPSKTLRTVNKN